ncbi:class I SAM-dependent methyltransferase [Longispora albida]|uniref:class I SAM-dependent methyltransferase n=1 Tax=Longispora albida TaxID=203523 RepID=UPI00036BD968|nr:SAM-dependent methyltransferase [Longispora albida]
MADNNDEAVKSTSDWMSAIRAAETTHHDAYLHDPYAAQLATPEHDAIMAEHHAAGSPIAVVIVRGRFGDEILHTAIPAGIRQIVSLGAGTDTRPWRLHLPPDLDYYEADFPGQLTAKHTTLGEPPCRYHTIETDLRHHTWPDQLTTAGYNPAQPAVWIAEGLFYYLTATEADQLLATISPLAAPGSHLLTDIPDTSYPAQPHNQTFIAYLRDRGSPFTGHTADPAAWLAPHGWHTEAYLPEHLHTCPWLPQPPPRLRDAYNAIWLIHATR